MSSQKRAFTYYIVLVILPGILITLLSFAVFWTDTASADALGFGIGIIVVNLLLNLILFGVLPLCSEVLWVDIFSTVNTLFCCIALFQSAFNIMLENHSSEHLLPSWIVFLARAGWSWIRSARSPTQVGARAASHLPLTTLPPST